ANAAGWNNAQVAVIMTASDDVFGSGVKSVTYSATAAVTISQTVVNGPTAAFTLNTEGTTVLTYHAPDNAGNVETAKTPSLSIDETPPVLTAPSDITQNNDPGKAYATVSPGSAGATDNLSGIAGIAGVRSDGFLLSDT